MAIVQTNLNTIPCGIALDNSTPHRAAFNRHKALPMFIDILSDGSGYAIWGESCLTLQGIDYDYNKWYDVSQEGVFREYFRGVLDRDRTPQQGIFFTGGFV